MAYRIPNADGNLNSTTIFDTVVNTPTINGSTNVALSTVTPKLTATFTAPNTANAVTGILIFVASSGATNITVTLQESGIDTACAKTFALPGTSNYWLYLRFATPYVYTTTGAGAYAFKFLISSSTCNLAADSGATLVSFFATDDRTGAVGSTDDLLLISPSNTGTRTITVTGANTFGSGTFSGINDLDRTVGYGLFVLNGGLFIYDIAASASITLKGSCRVANGGEVRIGTVANPYPTAFVATWTFDENSVTGNYGICVGGTGKFGAHGVQKTSNSLWKTTFVSGTGVAASPLVVADAVDWDVGDEIEILASSASATNYNECETKFIITKNSPTSYVLSATAGGAESAFTFTHTNAYVMNLQRNVIITSSNTSFAWWFNNLCTTSGNVSFSWVRCSYCGSTTGNRVAFYTSNASSTTIDLSYSVFYASQQTGLMLGPSAVAFTITGCIITHTSATGNVFYFNSNANNKTLIDCFVVNGLGTGFFFGSCSNAALTRCVAVGVNKDSAGNAGVQPSGVSHLTLTACESHCCRGGGVDMQSSAVDITATNCLFGTKGKNQAGDVRTTTNFYTAKFINCGLGSTTQTVVSSSMILGSLVAFQKFNQTTNDHRFFQANGTGISTGTGLADTNVRTSNSLALRIAATTVSPGFAYSFKIVASANSVVSVSGYIQKNAAFGTDVATVDLYLPGSITPDATYNMPNDVSWDFFSLAANNSLTTNDLATVVITAKTATANAYIYVDDLYNGTNVLTAMDVWDNGQPTPVMYPQLGDPNSVWAVLQNTQTSAGTMGYRLSKALTLPQYIGLK